MITLLQKIKRFVKRFKQHITKQTFRGITYPETAEEIYAWLSQGRYVPHRNVYRVSGDFQKLCVDAYLKNIEELQMLVEQGKNKRWYVLVSTYYQFCLLMDVLVDSLRKKHKRKINHKAFRQSGTYQIEGVEFVCLAAYNGSVYKMAGINKPHMIVHPDYLHGMNYPEYANYVLSHQGQIRHLRYC